MSSSQPWAVLPAQILGPVPALEGVWMLCGVLQGTFCPGHPCGTMGQVEFLKKVLQWFMPDCPAVIDKSPTGFGALWKNLKGN